MNTSRNGSSRSKNNLAQNRQSKEDENINPVYKEYLINIIRGIAFGHTW